MKLRILFCLLLSCCLYMAQAQKKTELCIVGTVHSPRSYFDSDTVYRILCQADADVVLIELDTAFLTVTSVSTWSVFPICFPRMKTLVRIVIRRSRERCCVRLMCRGVMRGIVSIAILKGRIVCGLMC